MPDSVENNRDTNSRLLEGENWRAKADSTFAVHGELLRSIGASIAELRTNMNTAITDLRDRMDGDRKSKTEGNRNLLTWVISSIVAVGGGMTFFVTSEINNNLFPVASRISAVEAKQADRSTTITRIQDELQDGRDARIKATVELNDRLIKIETYLDLMRQTGLRLPVPATPLPPAPPVEEPIP